MTTEHRYGIRHPGEIQVQIQYRKRRFFSAQGRDISERGMYLGVRNLTLPKGTMVTLEFHEGGRDWLIPAVVSHQDASGIGVQFRDPQPDLEQLSRLTDMPGRLMAHGAPYAGQPTLA
ncbi:PilZ domain-containing protein [Imhoffiella purpurea]|uniref:PilZ domain-containing protein n=1 Tax=Imhoffiella purpurea TaxID=1249627 RepID=W9VU77_9GAMM|nr:PilZ domain-containing protein [Imhoffiella purpurea]EXJ13910.1 hypothetical protein D779_3110 [Imhoffiella purpurea]